MSSKKLERFCESPILTFTSDLMFQGLFPQSQSNQNDGQKQNEKPIDFDQSQQIPSLKGKLPQNGRSKGKYNRKRKAIFKHDDKNKIFTFVSPHRGQKSNKNFVKFLTKFYFAWFKEFANPLNPPYYQYVEQLREKIYKEGRKKITLEHLKQIVGVKFSEREFQKQNRIIFRHILSSASIRKVDIVQSNFIKNKADKKQTLIATKVYNLRLRHISLINRLQSR